MSWIYTIIGIYLILMGILGLNLKVIYLTLTFKIRVYDFEDLYGRTAGRIIFIFLGILFLIFPLIIILGFIYK